MVTTEHKTLQNIPFYPQIWDLDSWNELGFSSREEALYWQNSSCGILCLKMAIEGLLDSEIDTIFELIQKGEQIGAFSDPIGWSHVGLAQLAGQYGVEAYARESIAEDEMKHILHHGGLVIVSAKWAFRLHKTLKEKVLFWKKSGGHLVLVTGYNEKGFIVNHTSITPGYNWQQKCIPFSVFRLGCTGRGVVVKR